MKLTIRLLFLTLSITTIAFAQTRPQGVSLCSLVNTPEKFDGKFVEVRGTVVLSEFFVLTDPNCDNYATLEYPNRTIRPAVRFQVVRDKHYSALQRALTFDHPHVRTDAKPAPGSLVQAEPFRTASAKVTFVGRIDARRAGGFDGGGADTPVRIVIRRVVAVESVR